MKIYYFLPAFCAIATLAQGEDDLSTNDRPLHQKEITRSNKTEEIEKIINTILCDINRDHHDPSRSTITSIINDMEKKIEGVYRQHSLLIVMAACSASNDPELVNLIFEVTANYLSNPENPAANGQVFLNLAESWQDVWPCKQADKETVGKMFAFNKPPPIEDKLFCHG